MIASSALRSAALAASLIILIPPAAGEARTGEIPLEKRRDARARGSVVPDGGFESGAGGWKIRNGRVQDERPYSGRRSLRLEAHVGGEALAEVEVPVIAGLYSLSAAVKFSGVTPGKGRTLADRFLARVLWLDAGRSPLPPRGRGEKGLPRSYPLAFVHRPLPDGWHRAGFVSSYEDPAGDEAPPGAAFARISFLLKGPGRAEIDDVRFAYSPRNLGLAERIAPFRSLDDDALGRVTPTPRHLVETGPPIPLRRICFSRAGRPGAGLVERLAAFEERLVALGASMVRRTEETDGAAGCDLTLHLAGGDPEGETPARDLLREARTLPSEGYLIRTRRGPGGRPVVIAAGADGAGEIYALETIRQLLRPAEGGGAALRAVEARDWPAFRGRSLAAWEPGVAGLRTIMRASRWLAGVKLNRLYLNYPLRTPRWWEPPDVYRALVAGLGERAAATGLYELGVLVNPYAQRERPEITDTFQISRKEDVDILWSEIAATIDAGARIVMLCLDDFLPSRKGQLFLYHLADPLDRERFASLGEAHLWLVDTLRERLRRIAPGTTLLMVPPWYNARFREEGGAAAESYLALLGSRLPADVGVAWTGPTVRSRIVDSVSTADFSGAIGDRPLVLWDNSVWELELSPFYANHPDRAGLVSLFEPFYIESEDFGGNSFKGEFYFNSSSGGRFRARAVTLADYLWNPMGYDPDRSIWRAMVAAWGRETAGALVDWDAAYWRERGWINRLAAARGKPGKALLARLGEARARSAEHWQAVYVALTGSDEELRRELETWVIEQEARYREARGLAASRP